MNSEPGLGTLFIVFTFKQFLCDFVLQTSAMARGKASATGWAGPLARHVGVHALGTLAIVLALAPRFWWLAIADFVVHGVIDRAKSLASLTTGWGYDEPRYWWLLGFDQCLHQLTHIALAFAIVRL